MLPRSRHCSDCDVCIKGYDHHCPWTSKCIGENNLWKFYAFAGYTPLFLVYCIVMFSLMLWGSAMILWNNFYKYGTVINLSIKKTNSNYLLISKNYFDLIIINIIFYGHQTKSFNWQGKSNERYSNWETRFEYQCRIIRR